MAISVATSALLAVAASWVTFATFATFASSAAAAEWPARVAEPRAFGHTIGDVLTQRVLLEANGHPVSAAAMPSAGRVGVWFERRAARVETDADGRRWLVLDYQLTNAPLAPTQVALPALELNTAAGDVLRVPEWRIGIGPLVADEVSTTVSADASGASPIADPLAGLSGIQPDRLAAPVALAPIRRRLGVALAALVVTLAAWGAWAWWRNAREAARLPFARAWRQMRRLDARAAQSESAWRVLHRALNETGGHVVHAGSLAAVIGRETWLQPLRPQLEQFYRQSDEHFFAVARRSDAAPAAVVTDAATDAATDTRGLVDLCRALYLAERRRQS
ncbi:calcium incorporation protein MxaA [Paraburkholderia kururiensis]|uniref:calcium incorporation protein MxaA n=1 Tax=Paraburkholderia kururiensis TaxID=984307 RepID=UPI00157A8338|nr:calcium incorporation protein MxaA [Paraburkholderia kururiensis]